MDLNKEEIPRNFFKDHIHLNHNVSYALGLSLRKALSEINWEKPYGGTCNSNPFSILTAKDIANTDNGLSNFSNSLISLTFLKFQKTITLQRNENDSLICIGYLSDKRISGRSGVTINEYEYAFSGPGYYMETIDNEIKGNVTLSPISGHKTVPNLMGRGISKGNFNYCYISELVFYNHNTNIDVTPSIKKENRKIQVNDFISIARRINTKDHNSNIDMQISPKSLDKLIDIAVSFEKEDLKLAKNLMYMANLLRPNGTVIKKKLLQYENNDKP
ncbi:hypothetical protein OW492_13520 [Psychromonas sp. 14N.309.X.WAT.B.A12]|uniref:hypothetical protein n=1 Tax=Psychromonas sp. 14N.309.X.WAT.B.A12 TaxID=2998322 RepID=UPI0025B1F65A|nr:hypothetical protein [Psychromonas sp. 14N.309.X.WAT.B.A12]MDN2664390.1 hypothetical protein [Psychromonas sp. 14N.309.X.WAT.B.A12]